MKSYDYEILLCRTLSDEKSDKFERVVSFLVNVVIALMILLLAMYLAVEPVEISGSSMAPNIHDGDTVVIDKLYSSPKRGDIVVIDAVNTRLIKRVVAVEGDRIGFVKEQYFDGYYISLYLDKGDGNGFVRINEPYIKEPMIINTLSSSGEGDRIFKAFTVADSLDDLVSSEKFSTVSDSCFVALGDNRNVSKDSRYYGQFRCSSIAGREFSVLKKGGFFDKFFSFFYTKSDSVNNNH